MSARAMERQPPRTSRRLDRLANAAGPLLLAGTLVAFTALVTLQLGRPLMYDDANFALAARAVAETGLPYGNQGWMSERGDFSQRQQWALWHPPLYVYLLGGAARLFGSTPAVLRSVGLLSGLLSAALTYRLAAEVTSGSPAQKRLAGGLAAALAFLSPLTVQSALILDIDFVLLLPLTLGFLLLYLRLEASRRRWLLLAPLFGVLLWAKMTNPLPLLAAVGAWQLLRGEAARAVVHPLAIGGLGAGLFGVTWAGIGTALGFPLEMPFAVNLVQAADSSAVARRAFGGAGEFIGALQPPVLWMSPALFGLGLAAMALRAGGLAGRWEVRKVDLLLGLALLLLLVYVNKTAGWFPKYQVVLAPLFACAAAPYLSRVPWANPRVLMVGAMGFLGSAWVVVTRVRDGWALARTWSVPEGAAALLLLLLIGAGGAMALGRPRVGMLGGLAMIALGWSLAIDAVQLRAPYATTYWYGTRGQQQAVEWVNANVQPAETYVGPKEIAYAARAQRYLDQDTLTYFLEQGRGFDGSWMGEPVRTIVGWTREPYVNDLLLRGLPPLGYREVARFADYVVLQRDP